MNKEIQTVFTVDRKLSNREADGHKIEMHDGDFLKLIPQQAILLTPEEWNAVEGCVEALRDARDTLLLCTVIDKSNASNKSFEIAE